MQNHKYTCQSERLPTPARLALPGVGEVEEPRAALRLEVQRARGAGEVPPQRGAVSPGPDGGRPVAQLSTPSFSDEWAETSSEGLKLDWPSSRSFVQTLNSFGQSCSLYSVPGSTVQRSLRE